VVNGVCGKFAVKGMVMAKVYRQVSSNVHSEQEVLKSGKNIIYKEEAL
jgi:hypothetical protein